MRKIFLFMMVSVDGFFEGEGHDLSWHNANNPEFEEFVHTQNNSLDTILMGHRTYDLMADFWPTQGVEADKETAQWFDRARKVVVAKPFTPTWSGTEVISDSVMESVRKLKEEPGTDIALLGSNMLATSLMQEGLIDEFRLMYSPVAIGKGTRLFTGMQKETKFSTLSTREFKSGNVLNCYRAT